MKVKGSALATIPEFIREQFGEESFSGWLEILTPEAREVYEEPILNLRWFDVPTVLIEPMETLCERFYAGDPRGAWDAGRFSADKALRGIYRMMVKIGSPSWLIERTSRIMGMFYDEGQVDVIEENKKSGTSRLKGVSIVSPMIELRVGGFMERGLEISGAKNLRFDMPSSMTRGDPHTDYHFAWD